MEKQITPAEAGLVLCRSIVKPIKSAVQAPIRVYHLFIPCSLVVLYLLVAYVNAGVEYNPELAICTIPPPQEPVSEETIELEPTVQVPTSEKPPKTQLVRAVKMDGSVESFIKRFLHVAKAEHAKFGIPVSISLAQGLIESANGQSYLAVHGNNFFGVRSYSGKGIPRHDDCCRKKGYKKGDRRCRRPDLFKKYTTAWESWRCHSKVLMNHRYQKHVKGSTNYRVWAKALKAGGYATDKKYAEKLIALIERYGLQKYDYQTPKTARAFVATD